MNNGSMLMGWRLPPEDLPKTPRWWTVGYASQSERAAVFFDAPSGRYELFRPPDKLVASGGFPLGWRYRLLGDGAVDAFITVDSSAVVLHDPEKNRVVWQRPCRLCKDISVSEDGTRFAEVGADGLEVWDTRTGQRLFQETRRIRHVAMAC